MASATDRLIVAADVTAEGDLRPLLERLEGTVRWIKVGSMLFCRTGPSMVERLVVEGWRVFLDLKLHDIPHQVAESVRAVSGLGAELLTVHTSGGRAMMERAAEAAAGSGLALLGVTVLTSLDDAALRATGQETPAEALVISRARLAAASGLDGVVSSPLEAGRIRAVTGASFEIVTPGIRPAGAERGDQRRTAAPAEAIRAGASRLVVGRPITGASDPRAAATAILKELKEIEGA